MGACRLAACRSAETTRATARREADGRASCASSAGAAAQRASLAGSPRNPNTSRHGCTDWCRTECVLCPAVSRARSAPAARLVLSAWVWEGTLQDQRPGQCLVRGLSPGDWLPLAAPSQPSVLNGTATRPCRSVSEGGPPPDSALGLRRRLRPHAPRLAESGPAPAGACWARQAPRVVGRAGIPCAAPRPCAGGASPCAGPRRHASGRQGEVGD